MVPRIPTAETRTNMCSFEKRLLKIGLKSKELQSKSTALASSKTAAPFFILIFLEKVFEMSRIKSYPLLPSEQKNCPE